MGGSANETIQIGLLDSEVNIDSIYHVYWQLV